MLPGCPTNGPAVSANGDRVAVAWFTAAHGKARVRVAFSRDGGATFGVPQDVDDGAPIGWTGIVFTEDDDAIVSWLEGQPGGGGQVRLRRLREGQRPGPSLVVADTRIGRATGIPQMARHGDVLVLAWRDERVRSFPYERPSFPALLRARDAYFLSTKLLLSVNSADAKPGR